MKYNVLERIVGDMTGTTVVYYATSFNLHIRSQAHIVFNTLHDRLGNGAGVGGRLNSKQKQGSFIGEILAEPS